MNGPDRPRPQGGGGRQRAGGWRRDRFDGL